jgi:hypothetical protein
MNSIMHITPYRTKYDGWAFDDEEKGLLHEPFVAGIPEIINAFAGDRDEVDIYFSSAEFPGCQGHLEKVGTQFGGTDYKLVANGHESMVGWLCPALFKYFETAPEQLWFQIK